MHNVYIYIIWYIYIYICDIYIIIYIYTYTNVFSHSKIRSFGVHPAPCCSFRRGTGNDATGLGRIVIIPSLDSRKSMGYFSWGNHRWGYSVMEIFHGILSGLFHGFQLCNVSEWIMSWTHVVTEPWFMMAKKDVGEPFSAASFRGLPSGKLSHSYRKIHHFEQVNQRTKCDIFKFAKC